MTQGESRYLYAIHASSAGDGWDSTGADLLDGKGWIVFTEALGRHPTNMLGQNYLPWSERGLGVIARLNHGYFPNGTIPLPQYYQDFAQRCANFVANSPGCHIWTIANECNHEQERPDGQPITPQGYAACYHLCRKKIKEVQPDAQVLLSGPAPWNWQTGDFGVYWTTVIEEAIALGGIDGVACHSYTHSPDPALIFDNTSMNPPGEAYYWQFRVYRDLLKPVPAGIPIYLTEADQEVAWLDANSGWVQNAYQEVADWNREHPDKTIRCLALYRWTHDKWAFADKAGVQDDFKLAQTHGYEWTEEEPMPDWTATYTNHCEDYHQWGEHPPITVLDGWVIDWDRSKPRPEMTFKYDPQQEVYKLDPPRSGVGFHVSTAFDWWMRTEQPINIAAGVRTKLAVALMVVAHGIGGDNSKLGDCGMQIGIGGPNEDELDSPNIVWSEWYTVRVGEGGNLTEYEWVIAETPETIPQVGRASLWIRCVANVAADISAGHFDLIQVLQITDDPVPPPTGTWRTVTYDPAGNVAGEFTFEGPSVNPQICAHAQAIVGLTCS